MAAMSPQSRGRRKKPRARRVARPAISSPITSLLREFARVGDPLEAAVVGSSMLGTLRDSHDPDDHEAVRALVADLGRRPRPESLALLDTFAIVADAPEVRTTATDAARSLRSRGVIEPPWTDCLGEVAAVEAWQARDVYGDQAMVVCTFQAGGARHGLGVLMDFNHLSGWAKDILVADDPEAMLRELQESMRDEAVPGTVEVISLATARRLIEDGIAATDMTWEPEVGDSYWNLRALVLARCRVMPPPEPKQEPREWSDAERDQIVDEFLRAAQLSASGANRYCSRLIVDYGCNYDPEVPLRVSPAKMADFLLGFLPRKVVLDAEDRTALPAVARSWGSWAAQRAQLPPPAVEELQDALAEILDEFDDAYDEPANMSPGRAMLSGLGTLSAQADVEAALERRMFAMPYFGTRIGDEDYPRLDPNDPDQRHLLIIGEHPEYHDALSDPAFDRDVDGVNPRLHVAIDEIVISQLWDDDPPETWHAAQRLLAGGMDRWGVIHRLGAVAVEQLHGALTDRAPIDAAAYAAAMDAVAPATNAKRRRKSAGHAVYQLKITLRGARPPIWRRIRIPSSATLPRLHDVIQAAFGWEDSHLHLFELRGRRYAPRAFELGDAMDDSRTSLAKALAQAGDRIRYDYDFGDGWEHEIVLEKVHEDDGAGHAVCIGGRRAGPVEDCGGVRGWQQLCEVLADPHHPDYAERVEWLGYVPDPTHFDQGQVNEALAAIRLA